MEVFNRHIMSRISMDPPVRVLVQACSMEQNIPMCAALGRLKYLINGTADYAENHVKNFTFGLIKRMKLEKPVVIAGYATKIVLDKKINISGLKIPLVQNNVGSLEVSLTGFKWTMGWNF